MLTARRQSKLSQDQLLELQKSTHFDKRELQQWYKGESTSLPPPTSLPCSPSLVSHAQASRSQNRPNPGSQAS